MDRILRGQTTWNLINIKARREQNTGHYVNIFRRLYSEDPLITLPREKCESLKSVTFSEILEENEPEWIQAILLSYTIVNPTAFYNKRSQENVNIDNWDSDIVANKKEATLFFIPSVHILVVKRNSDITLNNIVFYLSKALNRIESDMFDVDIIVERDILDKILNAHAVYSIEANISFSNPGHTNGFIAAFDNKLRNLEPNKFQIVTKGSKSHPLIKEQDGMLSAIINLSEQNGNIKAAIQPTEGSRLERIDSKDHPRVLTIPQIIDDFPSTIYNTIKRIFT